MKIDLKKYRKLKDGELKKEGDLFFNHVSRQWTKTAEYGSRCYKEDFPYYRLRKKPSKLCTSKKKCIENGEKCAGVKPVKAFAVVDHDGRFAFGDLCNTRSRARWEIMYRKCHGKAGASFDVIEVLITPITKRQK